MSDLMHAIFRDIDEGLLSFKAIAAKHDVELDFVYDVLAEYTYQLDCDDSDSDGYALASAGFGTDEDYGYFGGEE